jgi:Trypsin-like peptidase domain
MNRDLSVFFLSLSFVLGIASSLAAQPTAAVRPPTTDTIVARARRMVVVVKCSAGGREIGLGSGFIADSVGLVVTNAHVVLPCDEVALSRGGTSDELSASIVLLDLEHDIAVLDCSELRGGALRLADGLPRVGQHVYAVGHPEGLEFTVSDGIVSAIRDLPTGIHMVQTTAPISPGNSGGPLLDAWGHVVGMTTSYLSEGQNLNFAVANDDIGLALREARAKRATTFRGNDATHFLSSRSTPRGIAATARGFREAQKYALARSVLSRGLDCCPDDSLILLEQAELAWAEQRIADCSRHTDRLLELYPSFAPGHQCKATLLMKQSDLEGARVSFPER